MAWAAIVSAALSSLGASFFDKDFRKDVNLFMVEFLTDAAVGVSRWNCCGGLMDSINSNNCLFNECSR